MPGEAPPWPKVRHKGKQAQGKTYERKLIKHLEGLVTKRNSIFYGRELLPSPWIYFLDINGKGWAQPDALLVHDNLVWIFEAKLTHTEDSVDQLLKLYVPLVKHIWPNKGHVAMEVCHNIGPIYRADKWTRVMLFDDVYENFGKIYLYHWMG